jgi:2-polyprenyl-3-methyl-5-hydroxy-6-metoxy-1,4-benzoquinol methylase
MAIAQHGATRDLPALNRAQRRRTRLCARAATRVRDIACGGGQFPQAVDGRVKRF